MTSAFVKAPLKYLPLWALLVVSGCDDSGGGTQPETRGDGDGGVELMHRMTASALDLAIGDLLAIEAYVSEDLPTDAFHEGFDNQTATLRVSPTWLSAAELTIREHIDRALANREYVAESLLQSAFYIGSAAGAASGNSGVADGTYTWTWATEDDDAIHWVHSVNLSGEYEISVQYLDQEYVTDPGEYFLKVDGIAVDVGAAAPAGSSGTMNATVVLSAGTHVFTFENIGGSGFTSSVDFFVLEGPAQHPQLGSTPRRNILPCAESDGSFSDDCAHTALTQLSETAWRGEDTDAVGALYDELRAAGEAPYDSLQTAISAIILSPRFLYAIYRDWDSQAPEDDLQMLQRLSRMLWNRPADDDLLQRADTSNLRDRNELAALVDEMLADPRASTFVDTFATQWLSLDWITFAEPSREDFPEFTESLRKAMSEELRELLERTFLGGGDLRDIITSTEGRVTDELAAIYGDQIASRSGNVASFDPRFRSGIHTRAGMLTGLSNPRATHPTRRGYWILDRMLCAPPPPPPQDVPRLGDADVQGGVFTGRDRLAQHLSDSNCVSCHVTMDPIGLALENFDALGRWRDEENGVLIDATATVEDWAPFEGGVELGERIAADPRYASCIVENLFTFALGRAPRTRNAEDAAVIERATEAFVDSGYRLRPLLIELADSHLFRANITSEATP